MLRPGGKDNHCWPTQGASLRMDRSDGELFGDDPL